METIAEKKYSYKKEEDRYVLYDGDSVLCNPHGKVVSTEYEDLAKRLVTALEKGEDYTSGGSLLCYHYTYANLVHHTVEEFMDNFSPCMNYDTFLWDEYLMFKQGAPVKQAFAPALAEEFLRMLETFNKYQYVAILVVNSIFDSWVLSLRFIWDIIEEMKKGRPYAELKEEFMSEMDDYERSEFADQADYDDYDDDDYDDDDNDDDDDVFDEERYARHCRQLSDTIDAFVYYFTLGKDLNDSTLFSVLDSREPYRNRESGR